MPLSEHLEAILQRQAPVQKIALRKTMVCMEDNSDTKVAEEILQ